MLKKIMTTTVFAGMICCGTSVPVKAEGFGFEKENLMIRLRAINVMPDESSSMSIADRVKAGNQIVPELDFTYFWSDHWATELILATSEHHMSTAGGLDLGDVWILPPTLTLQYHFTPEQRFRPYVGAGLNYTFFYNEDPGASITGIDYDNGVGYALQAGFDYGIDAHWAINFDVKKIWLNTDVTTTGPAVTADVDLDPWVFGTGVSYRF